MDTPQETAAGADESFQDTLLMSFFHQSRWRAKLRLKPHLSPTQLSKFRPWNFQIYTFAAMSKVTVPCVSITGAFVTVVISLPVSL